MPKVTSMQSYHIMGYYAIKLDPYQVFKGLVFCNHLIPYELGMGIMTFLSIHSPSFFSARNDSTQFLKTQDAFRCILTCFHRGRFSNSCDRLQMLKTNRNLGEKTVFAGSRMKFASK